MRSPPKRDFKRSRSAPSPAISIRISGGSTGASSARKGSMPLAGYNLAAMNTRIPGSGAAAAAARARAMLSRSTKLCTVTPQGPGPTVRLKLRCSMSETNTVLWRSKASATSAP